MIGFLSVMPMISILCARTTCNHGSVCVRMRKAFLGDVKSCNVICSYLEVLFSLVHGMFGFKLLVGTKLFAM